jgi:hypothetical protein
MADIPLPGLTVNVSLFVDATIVVCPGTAMFLKMFCEEPLSLFVTVIEPLLVIGPPATVIPVPAVRLTEVTVPTYWSLDVTVKLGYVPVTTEVPAPVIETTWSGALLVIVKLGYVPDVDIPVPAFNTTTWSGAVLVTVMDPLVVIGPPLTLIPVLAVKFTDVTVPLYWSVAAIVKLGYVPVIVTLEPAVSETTWSGALLVIVSVSVVALVVNEIPVPEAMLRVS